MSKIFYHNTLHKRHRIDQLQFSESNQERLFPKLGFGNESIIFANYGALQKAKWSISFELGYSKKPALHGRLNSSTDTEIRKFLMEFRRIFMSKYYDYFEEQEHNSGEITMDNAHE